MRWSKSEFDFDEISKTINDALNLGSDNDAGYDYIADFEKRFQIKARNPVTTGWQQIDSISRATVLAQESLVYCIAPTGAGKSCCARSPWCSSRS